MTKKLFWENPYLTELKTTVHTVCDKEITLNETIFYAFSGGQESDHGTFNDQQVLAAKKLGQQIFYTLNDNHRLQAGDNVTIKIDWDRRYKLMRLHFAAEVVLELVYKKFPDMTKVGAHIAPEKARIDFECHQTITALLPALQKDAQQLIDADLPIISAFSDESTEQRYWEVIGFSKVPCGGTHIRKTREVGNIHLRRVNPGKGKERIEIFVS